MKKCVAVMLFEAEAKSNIQHILCPAAAAACVLHCVFRGCFSVLPSDDTLCALLRIIWKKEDAKCRGKGGKSLLCTCGRSWESGDRNCSLGSAEQENWENSLTVSASGLTNPR